MVICYYCHLYALYINLPLCAFLVDNFARIRKKLVSGRFESLRELNIYYHTINVLNVPVSTSSTMAWILTVSCVC